MHRLSTFFSTGVENFKGEAVGDGYKVRTVAQRCIAPQRASGGPVAAPSRAMAEAVNRPLSRQKNQPLTGLKFSRYNEQFSLCMRDW
jgi:hypothetical protein